jgi:hypothetical protein
VRIGFSFIVGVVDVNLKDVLFGTKKSDDKNDDTPSSMFDGWSIPRRIAHDLHWVKNEGCS